jgi:hypothetical protein
MPSFGFQIDYNGAETPLVNLARLLLLSSATRRPEVWVA